MKLLNRFWIVLSAVSVLAVYSANRSFADSFITENPPQTVMTPEKKLDGGGSGKWLWALLGVALIGGAAAAAGGSGGGGGGDEPTTGTVSGSW